MVQCGKNPNPLGPKDLVTGSGLQHQGAMRGKPKPLGTKQNHVTRRGLQHQGAMLGKPKPFGTKRPRDRKWIALLY